MIRDAISGDPADAERLGTGTGRKACSLPAPTRFLPACRAMPDALPLSGMTIVVTRPRQQGESTAKALRSAGASAIEMPVLEITPLACMIDLGVLTKAYAAIFVSVNAVEHGLPCLRAHGALAKGTLIMSIGHATATALRDAGIERVVSPQQNIDSEGLLALPQLQQVQGQTIILMRGHSLAGGRNLLEETVGTRRHGGAAGVLSKKRFDSAACANRIAGQVDENPIRRDGAECGNVG
ncbi:MAG: uroporphyrinogen-III synthase [Betaproteobacteria bacterium]|nr:uroporphyrinogen-III synthase [Betaproteobacteria bacterium]